LSIGRVHAPGLYNKVKEAACVGKCRYRVRVRVRVRGRPVLVRAAIVEIEDAYQQQLE